MPLETYRRGKTWWVKGRCDGIDGYVRESLGTTDEAVAKAEVRKIERRALKRAILGDDAPKREDELTFSEAVLLYTARPRDADYLLKILPHLGDKKVRDITGKSVKALAREMYPTASVDTWQRQVIVPVRAVINNAHEEMGTPPIRIKAFTRNDRMAQDRARGKDSGRERTPGSWEWIDAFRATAKARRNPYIAALALFMFTTGARISQATDIKPRDLDLQRARVLMPTAKGHPAQWVEITMELVVELANLPPRGGKVFGYKSRSSVYGAWATTCKKAGIEDLDPHEAGRHGFGTEMLVRQKLDPVTVAKAGRWSSPSVPLRTYGHSENAADKVREALQNGRNRTNPVQHKTIGSSK